MPRSAAIESETRTEMRFHRIAVIVLLFFVAGIAAAELPPLVADSAALDRSYIPALMLSNGKELAKAVAAQDAYEKAWATFAARQRDAKPGDAEWSRMFVGVEKANGEARSALAAGKTSAAHNAQEEVRHLLWHERRALGFAYQPDLLTDFHATMELIIAGVEGKGAAGIGAAEIAESKRQLAEARRRWEAVKSSRWDPAEYGLDAARLDQYRAALAAEDKALEELGAALDAADGARIAKAAPAIKPPFAKAYAAFGVFPQ
jgi:hypothetical protein